VVGGLAALVLVLWLLGRYYPGSGLEQVGLRSARELAERREALEAEDLDQLLSAHNARKRARGEDEVTAEEFEARVLNELRERRREH
jgi:transcriptional regulator NrdR family protein